MQLIGVVPTDCSVLAKTGEIYDNDGDKSQAFQYYYDVSKNAEVEMFYKTHSSYRGSE